MTKEHDAGDAKLQHDVLRALARDSRVCAADVGVTVHHGVVTLTGTVPDYGERLAATEITHQVAGVLDVADDIEVKSPGTAGHTDTEIAERVRDLLQHDALIPHDAVHLTVARGWVRLEGALPLANQRLEAERLVWQVPGVCGVTNTITVTGSHAGSREDQLVTPST
jgi:osmotically-inducible protein OsmY